MNIICRAWKHSPMDFVTAAGLDVVICRRCGVDISEWAKPFIGKRTRAALFSAAGVGLGVYAAMDAQFVGTGDAVAAGLVATLAAICAQFGTDRMTAGK